MFFLRILPLLIDHHLTNILKNIYQKFEQKHLLYFEYQQEYLLHLEKNNDKDYH